MTQRQRRGAALVAVAVAALVFASAAAAADTGPKLTVPKSSLEAGFTCPIDPTDANVTPVMLVTGTGVSGGEAYLIGQDAFEAYGHPVCLVNFPDFTTADIQVSVEYLVYGLRQEYKLAGRKVAVFGISQGGLLPRFALTYWPDLRNKVSDVIAAAGTQHGTNIGTPCSAMNPCIPAGWQQAAGSKLLTALNSQPDETPGPVSYTTVRSLTDETVQPQDGPSPTSALEGASNILIQDICPGRTTTHIGTALDSVTFAAIDDAIAHNGKRKAGAADVSRFPAEVCDHPYAPGLDETETSGNLGGAGGLVDAQVQASPHVSAEPKVRKVFRKPAP